MVDYEICHFPAGHFDDYLSFVNRFRENKCALPEDLRRKWWVFENPNGGHYVCAYTANEICSTCHVSGKILRIDGENVLAFELGDGWTSPPHRRKGLFIQLVSICRDLVFKYGAQIVYGAPNAQASPIYEKLGFLFERRPDSFLNLIPSPINLLLHRSRFSETGIRDTLSVRSGNPQELTFDEYFQASREFARCNETSESYLRWRLAFTPLGYRFFSTEVQGGRFLFAIRKGDLASLQTLYVAEHCSLGLPSGSKQFYAALRRVASRYYRAYDGIYLLATASSSSGKLPSILKHGFITHRQLPVCYTFAPEQQPSKSNPVPALLCRFQLSDCDIG